MSKIPDEIKSKAVAYRDNTIYIKTEDMYDAVLYGYSLAEQRISELESNLKAANELIDVSAKASEIISNHVESQSETIQKLREGFIICKGHLPFDTYNLISDLLEQTKLP